MAQRRRIVTLRIFPPKPIKQRIDGKVSSEFAREAIREKLQREQSKPDLTQQLLAGLDSGTPILFGKGHFAQKKRALGSENEERRGFYRISPPQRGSPGADCHDLGEDILSRHSRQTCSRSKCGVPRHGRDAHATLINSN
jgi:hypothetical protein